MNRPGDPSPESPTYNNRGEMAKAGPTPGTTIPTDTSAAK